MANIEPYQYQKTTNIKEHNDIVSKVNEIIQVVNDTNLESVGIKFNSIDSEIASIKSTDSLQWADIETLKTNDPVQDATLSQHTEEIKELTDSSVSNVSIVDGYNMGTFKVRIDRKGAVNIESNEYALESPTSIELIQGTGPSMFKCQITLSDGRTLVSNDFVFTTEYIGQDIYISSFTFKAGNVDGTISADIGLSNGVTIEANNFAIPVQPTVSNAINDLNTRVQSLEDTTVSDVRITNIETKNTEQDSEIETITNDIQFINTEINGIKEGPIVKSNSDFYNALGLNFNVNIPITFDLSQNAVSSFNYYIVKDFSNLGTIPRLTIMDNKVYMASFEFNYDFVKKPFTYQLVNSQNESLLNQFTSLINDDFISITMAGVINNPNSRIAFTNDTEDCLVTVNCNYNKGKVESITHVNIYANTPSFNTVLTKICSWASSTPTIPNNIQTLTTKVNSDKQIYVVYSDMRYGY